MIRQMMRSLLCFWVVAVCLQLQLQVTTKTKVYGLEFERFLELVGALPACQSSKEDLQTEQKFHGDYICSRRMLNDPVTRAADGLRFALLPPSQSMKIPHEQTLYCPTITTHEALLLHQEASVVIGHKERWIIKNEATKPVSISFWDQEKHRLVSARNPDISPAHHDQEAIVYPGEWNAISTWQGHVFVMHQLEWVEGELVQGRILATHRVGLVPIGLNFEAPPLQMADIPLTDPEPHTTAASTERTLSKSASTPGDLTERTPPNHTDVFCNVMHKGFINEANYPLDLYFAGHRPTFSNNNDHQQTKQTLEDEKDSNNLPPLSTQIQASFRNPLTHRAHELRFAQFPPSQSMKIPREQTLFCPPITTHEALLLDQEISVMVGYKERWILKNEATKPVSVSFWDQEERKLVSAFNPDISPAHHDQEAIVYPGEWNAISTWQGHVFVMHQLEWVEGELVQGRILATHRVGLVPIGLNFEAPPLQMADIPLTDPEPHTTAASTERTLSKSASTPGDLTERTPPNHTDVFCNVMHKGFINEANYPLDLYFAGHRPTFSNNNDHQQTKQTLEDEKDSNNLPPCRHEFKLHLGAHHDHNNNDARWDDPSQDAHHTLDDWGSPLKYDGTYVSHNFVARFHHDPSIIVQEYTVSPVIVRDCLTQEESKESIFHQADTVATTMPIIQDEISMSLSTSTISSFHLASSLSTNSTIYYDI
eukprot:CAMPEP_0198303680 /NCGR_PEP_ID=MMETSP1449-20131203/57010_1 /TAXON_ID=420275 /ORGANISM="Attheya septentrionalis, Strain CCMP2084" /LENGTH=708 /DNA_ID=CAMNT_0044006183 /DNA_START=140 /DNA_END=2265 /DNA_ORIENTATION=-